MGLDSVELIISIEKHFAITIRDGEAEKAFTVQDVADLVARHRPIIPSARDVRSEVRAKLLAAWPDRPSAVPDELPFKTACAGRAPHEVWAAWQATGLKMPELPPRDIPARGRTSALAFLLPKWMSGRSVRDLRFGQVLDAIVAHNHLRLIDPLRPASAYEILMAVIGVSSDSIGVPELEIRPTDSFTNDLGID